MNNNLCGIHEIDQELMRNGHININIIEVIYTAVTTTKAVRKNEKTRKLPKKK